MQAHTAIELAGIGHVESGQPIIRQKLGSRERFFMMVSPILMIWSGLMLLLEVLTLGFRRDYTVYGSGIWVGLSTAGFSCLLSASLGRSGQSWAAGLLVAGSTQLAVLAAGLGVACFELNYARQRFNQQLPNSCDSCGELVMVKCGFQIVGYASFVALVGAVIYKVGGRLCACGKSANQAASPETKGFLKSSGRKLQPNVSASQCRAGQSQHLAQPSSAERRPQPQQPQAQLSSAERRSQPQQPQAQLSSAERRSQPQQPQAQLSSAEQRSQPQQPQAQLSSAERRSQPQQPQAQLSSAEQRSQPQQPSQAELSSAERRSQPQQPQVIAERRPQSRQSRHSNNSSSSSSIHQRSSSGRRIPHR